MNHRTRNIILSLIILVAGWGISRFFVSQKQHLQKKPSAPTPREATTLTIKTAPLNKIIHTSGRLQALNKIEIFAEVTGVLLPSSKLFRPGASFRKGEILLEIDDSVYRNNLFAQRSAFLNHITLMLPDLKIDLPEAAQRWENYLESFAIDKTLPEIPQAASSKENFYLASHNIFERFYTIRSMEATWKKYRIEAPFDGVLTQALINPGTLVRAGQKLGEFTSVTTYEAEMAVSIREADFIKPYQTIRLHCEDIPGHFKGSVVRINKAIDPSTQTVSAFIRVSDPRLRDGMYMEAELTLTGPENVARIPAQSVINDSLVEVVKQNGLSRIPIATILEEDHSLYVTGLQNGMTLNLKPGESPTASSSSPQLSTGGKGKGQ